MRRGFTLVELLVVITIIGLVTAAVIGSGMLGAIRHRQVSEAARILQASLAGARDAAIRDNGPSGIRLLPDPTLPGAFSALLPMTCTPNYSEGLVACYPAENYDVSIIGTATPLVFEQMPGAWQPAGNGKYVFLPVNPTSWAYNVRLGDQVQINSAGPWMTVCGPCSAQTSEGFTNTTSALSRTFTAPDGQTVTLPVEFLLLANGRDDNANGYPDDGWDGVDNDGDGLTDETSCKLFPAHGEWEQEAWPGWLAQGTTSATYVIRRRPVPASNGRSVSLPTQIVIDAARSRLPAPTLSGTIDLQVNSDGTMAPITLYGVPTSIGLTGAFWQFWLSERADIGQPVPAGQWWLVSANTRTGRISSMELPDLVMGYVQAMQGR